MNALTQIDTYYSKLVDQHAPIYNVAGKKHWQPDPDITPEALKLMREDVEDRIIVARVGLLLRHPFFGNMATRLKIVCGDDWCPTAAVDGRNLYFNTQFLMHFQIVKLNLLLHMKFYIVCLII